MAARLSRSIVVAAWLVLALLGTACGAEHGPTGVRLTILYEQPPALLHIAGATKDGRVFGPSIVPSPPRKLAPDGETLWLALPDEMDGAMLSLSVTGLSARRVALMRGFVRTEIVPHSIQSAFVWLSSDPAPGGDASVPLPDVDPIADASVDESPIDAATPVQHDAADQDPVFDPEPLDPEPLDPEPLDPEPLDPEPLDPEPLDPEPLDPDPEPDAGVPCAGSQCPMALQCTEQDVCDVKCPSDGLCAIACGGARDCRPGCKNASCDIRCDEAEHCHPSCEGHADCEITCTDADACRDVSCKDDARCLLRCAGDACNMRCKHEEDRKVCDNGVIVCNRECPEGG